MTKKHKNILICFIGIDGSGKSTLARWLLDTLQRNGTDGRLLWGAYQLSIFKPVFRLGEAILLPKKSFTNHEQYYASAKKLSRHSSLSSIYEGLLLFEYFFQILFRVTVPLITGRNVICDRYVYDTFIHLAVNLGYSNAQFKSKLARFLRLCPKPDVIFMVDIPEEIAITRKQDIPSLGYLKRRREYYSLVRDEYKVIILDGSGNLEKLEDMVKAKVGERLGDE
ncbi:dTMP kinase [Chloroflexota bacterium]